MKLCRIVPCVFTFCLLALAPLQAQQAGQTDEATLQKVAERFEDLKQSYQTALDRASDKLLEKIDQAIRDASEQDEEGDEVKGLKIDRSQFANFGKLPKQESLSPSTQNYIAEVKRLNAAMGKVYEQAVAHYTKALELDEATRIQEEYKSWKASLPEYSLADESKRTASNDVLTRATEAQYDEFLTAQKVLRTEVDRQMRQAAQRADLEQAKLFRGLLEELDANSVLETVPSLLTIAYNKYLRTCDLSHERLEVAFRKELSNALRSRDVERVQEIYRQLVAGIGVGPRRWFLLFRSEDPKIWGTDYQAADGFARTLDQAPEDLRFLRLKRVDTGETVIIDLTAQRLGANFTNRQVGWAGGPDLYRNQHSRLGIYYVGRNEERTQTGDLVIGSTGFQGHTGWGFATLHNVDNRQAFAWAGREIPQTAFEIAVTAENLHPAELRRRLK